MSQSGRTTPNSISCGWLATVNRARWQPARIFTRLFVAL
jgi:hypothetical protein